jgi:hypothetical protein
MRLALAALFLAGIISAQSTIDGRVINNATRAGIEGVSVLFYTLKGTQYRDVTASDGSFHIAGVQQGAYRYSVEKEGFELPPGPEFPAAPPMTQINGKDAVQVVFEMTAWTTLRGRVVGEDGKPAAQVSAQIRGALPLRGDNEIRTAADGSFQFNLLPPGEYRLVARPKPANSEPVQGVRMEAVATYYSSALDPEQAQTIAIRGIGEESGIEIRLRRVPVFHVRGVVLDEASKPARGITVSILPAKPPPWGRLGAALGGTVYYLPGSASEPLADNAITAADGTFDFPSVPAGDWIVSANSEWQYEEATHRDIRQTGQATTFVGKTDTDGVEIHLAENFEFSASVVWPKDAPYAARFSMISLLAESTRPDPGGFGEMKPDGTVQFERLYLGRNLVAPIASGMPDIYVAEVQFGGRDVLGQVIELAPNPPPMTIVYKTGAGVIRAQFEKEAPGIFVLIPAEPQGGYPRCMRCDSKGPCEFRGLRPGDYYAAGFDRVDGVELSDPEYVSSLIHSATRVHVEENGNELLNLPINHWPD